jgi:bifunctional UDP-N-acetylglucosamine pyrophosphorylase/glucosamine-1-phosphate N-acetyltransferase
MAELRTIILAAGKGTRMKSERPKVLHQVCGVPILQYVLDVARAAGSLKTYVVCGYQLEAVRNFLGPRHTVVRQERQQGTADAVRCVQKHLSGFRGDVLILCGDTPLLSGRVVKQLVRNHRRTKADCTFLTAEVGDPSGYGRVLRDAGGRVKAICEDNDLSGDQKNNMREINVGVYCVQAPALHGVLKQIKINQGKKEYYLTDMVALMSRGGLRVETVTVADTAEGLGVNSRVDLAFAEKVIRRRILEKLMLGGVTIVDPETAYIRENVRIGRDTVIQPCTVIDENVVVGKSCVIGPFTHLRPGSRIGNNVEVGNFAEVSRSSVGKGCFVKHFSFLGDAQLGDYVNIGAGTVTANFDGVHKNKTKIGNRAFIGSDSVLVAPVSVGKGAVIGAGSVVTRGQKIPDRAVAFGVPAKIKSRRSD